MYTCVYACMYIFIRIYICINTTGPRQVYVAIEQRWNFTLPECKTTSREYDYFLSMLHKATNACESVTSKIDLPSDIGERAGGACAGGGLGGEEGVGERLSRALSHEAHGRRIRFEKMDVDFEQCSQYDRAQMQLWRLFCVE